jgi:hypothetical protein
MAEAFVRASLVDGAILSSDPALRAELGLSAAWP